MEGGRAVAAVNDKFESFKQWKESFRKSNEICRTAEKQYSFEKECLTSGKVNKLWPFPDRNTQERVLKSFSITKEIAAIKVKRFRKYCRNKACAEDVKLAIIKDLRELMDMGANLKELTVLLSQAELVEAVKEISALKGRKAHQQDSKIAI